MSLPAINGTAEKVPVSLEAENPHAEKIQELRKRVDASLKKYPAYNTEFSLQRWLRYFRYDTEVAAPNLEAALETIGCLGGFTYPFNSPDEINDVLNELAPAAPYFAGGFMGQDRNGNIITMNPVGRVRPKTLMTVGRVSDLYKISILECEANLAFLRKEEARLGRKLSVILIYDLAEFSTSVVSMSSIKVYMNNINYLQHLFPDSISRIYVVNAPAAVNFIYQMVKHVLAKKTVNKVQFLGSDWKEVLKKELGEENILPYWGGTKVADCPTGKIRMGGEVPDEVKNKFAKLLRLFPKESLTPLKVSASTEVTVPVVVQKRNVKLKWYFTVSSGDVDFFITYDKAVVWPNFRISTEFVPEFGEIVCQETGTYLLHFDNHHSYFKSKEILYNVFIEEDSCDSGGGDCDNNFSEKLA